MTEPLKRERIVAELEALGASCPVAIAEETESTNDDARAGAEAGAPHGAVYLADHQRAGRGRRGHRWHSPPRENLYLSLLLRPELPAERLAPLSLVAGVAVARVVDAALGRRRVARIKWPNDVLLDDGKIAGILIESALTPERRPFRDESLEPPGGSRGREPRSARCICVVGVGLNVLTEAFPSDPSHGLVPTSLRLAGATELDREILAARLVATLRELCDAYSAAGIAPLLADLDERDALRGRAIEVDGVRGIGAGIDQAGRLVFEAEGVRRPIVSGSVRFP